MQGRCAGSNGLPFAGLPGGNFEALRPSQSLRLSDEGGHAADHRGSATGRSWIRRTEQRAWRVLCPPGCGTLLQGVAPPRFSDGCGWLFCVFLMWLTFGGCGLVVRGFSWDGMLLRVQWPAGYLTTADVSLPGGPFGLLFGGGGTCGVGVVSLLTCPHCTVSSRLVVVCLVMGSPVAQVPTRSFGCWWLGAFVLAGLGGFPDAEGVRGS